MSSTKKRTKIGLKINKEFIKNIDKNIDNKNSLMILSTPYSVNLFNVRPQFKQLEMNLE